MIPLLQHHEMKINAYLEFEISIVTLRTLSINFEMRKGEKALPPAVGQYIILQVQEWSLLLPSG